MGILKRIDFGSVREKVFLLSCLGVMFFFAALDQWTKYLVVSKIPEHSSIKIIPGLFNLTYVNNPGAAWGILAGRGWILITISVVVFICIIFFLRILTEGWPERYFAFFLVLSGIIGNSVDRVGKGKVVDFLDFYVNNCHWPAFNVADSCITVGVVIFITSSVLRPSNLRKGQALLFPF